MPLFLTAQLMAGTALITLASLHLAVGSRTAVRRDHTLLAITALLAAAEAFCASWQYHLAAPQFAIAIKLYGVFRVLFESVLAWFLVCYVNLPPRWIPKVVTAWGAVVILLNLSLPVHPQSPTIPDSRNLYPLRADRIARMPFPLRWHSQGILQLKPAGVYLRFSWNAIVTAHGR